MSVRWAHIRPWQRVIARVKEAPEEPDEILLFCQPQWIKLPEELGGEPRRVIESEEAVCRCGRAHVVPRHELAGGDGFVVFECPTVGIIWCQESDDE